MSLLLTGGTILYVLFDSMRKKDEKKDKKPKFDVLELRDFEGLSSDTQDAIRTITTIDDISPVGSFKYRAHKYPGDIDIFEPIKACCTEETATKTIAKKIQKIASDVRDKKDIYLADFKAGVDERFDLDVGDYVDDTVINYDAKEIRKKLHELYQLGLLNEKEFNELFELVKDKPTGVEHEALKTALRKYYVVRWTIDEILDGYKILRGNIKLSLPDALMSDSIVKMDLWAKTDGNYTEVTNFYLIIAVDETGKQTVLNQKLGDRLENLDHDIKKYSNKEHRNSLKLAKRLWNKAILLNDHTMLEKLYPLFSKDINSLNQIVSESATIREMLKKLKNPPWDDLIRQINRFKRRINDNAYEPDLDTEPIYVLIDQIVREYKRYGNKMDPTLIEENLESIERLLKVVIEPDANAYLKSVGIRF